MTDNEFILFVTSTEHIKLKGIRFAAIKGVRVGESLGKYPILCKSSSTNEVIAIDGQSFSPTRAGLEGKILSHMMQEGNWTTKSEISDKLKNSFLLPSCSSLFDFSYDIKLIKYYIDVENKNLHSDVIGHPIPVVVANIGLKGVLILSKNDIGILKILNTQEPELLNTELELFLANKDVFDKVAFEIVMIE